MKRSFLHSVLVASLLFLCSCGGQQEAVYEVMTFNIRLDHAADSLNNWKYRKDNAAAMITYYSPDLIGMQEVLHNQLTDLKERLPQYSALGVGRADGKEGGEYCSVFYKTERFEVIREGTYGLSETPEVIGAKGWDAACERIVTWAILKDKQSGRQLAFFNTHFDHIGQIARKESAILLTTKMSELAKDLPAIITGDFNATPNSEVVAQITQHQMLEDSRLASPIVYGPSWTFHDFGRIPVERRTRIDYVFVTPQIHVNKYRVIDDRPDTGFLSDHNPVITTLTLN